MSAGLASADAARAEYEPLIAARVGQPYVYFLYNDTARVIYVGSTRRLPVRLNEHRRRQPWYGEVAEVRAWPFGTLDEALAAEAAAIREHSPRYNRQGRRPSELALILEAFFGGAR